MTKEEKDLLLKDLCARLPYGAVLKVRLIDNYDDMVERNIKLTQLNIGYAMSDSHWLDFKVYLRPLSSMTETEKEEYKAFHCVAHEHTYFYPQFCTVANELNMFDWLNAHHFDYRGLIKMGLALEVTEGMYNN